jgi:ribosomal protein S1
VTHIPVPLCRNSKRQVVLSAAAVDTSLAWQRLAQAAQLCFDTHQPLPVTVRHQAAGYVRCSALGVPAIVPRSQLLAPGAQDATTAATDSTTSTTSSTSSSQQQQEVLEVMVMELDQEGKRAVMSQRLAAEAAQQRAAAAAQRTSGLVVGQLATGTITSVSD